MDSPLFCGIFAGVPYAVIRRIVCINIFSAKFKFWRVPVFVRPFGKNVEVVPFFTIMGSTLPPVLLRFHSFSCTSSASTAMCGKAYSWTSGGSAGRPFPWSTYRTKLSRAPASYSGRF
nr:MAG TPA: hypothetical protein [Caudoviricetes sp.]